MNFLRKLIGSNQEPIHILHPVNELVKNYSHDFNKQVLKTETDKCLQILELVLQLNHREPVLVNNEPVLDVNGEKMYYIPDYYQMHFQIMGIFVHSVYNFHREIFNYLLDYPLLDMNYMDGILFDLSKDMAIFRVKIVNHHSFVPTKSQLKYLATIKDMESLGKCLIDSANLDNELKTKRPYLLEHLKNFDYERFCKDLDNELLISIN